MPVINKYYRTQGRLIEDIKAAAAQDEQAARVLNKYNLNLRHSVQISMATVLMLCIGRTQVPYDANGNLDHNALKSYLATFVEHYSTGACTFLRPLITDNYMSSTYPLFSEIKGNLDGGNLKLMLAENYYTNNWTKYAGKSPSQPSGNSLNFNTVAGVSVPAGYLMANYISADGKTPMLDRFKLKSVDNLREPSYRNEQVNKLMADRLNDAIREGNRNDRSLKYLNYQNRILDPLVAADLERRRLMKDRVESKFISPRY